jgi:hypothetical protein
MIHTVHLILIWGTYRKIYSMSETRSGQWRKQKFIQNIDQNMSGE